MNSKKTDALARKPLNNRKFHLPRVYIGLGLDRTPENKNAMGAYLAFNPTYDQMNDQLGEMSRQLGRKYRRVRSSFPALMFEMSSYAHLLRFIHARGEERDMLSLSFQY